MLFERDRFIFELCKEAGIPCLFCLAGGYLEDMDKLVSLHVGTFKRRVRLTSKVRFLSSRRALCRLHLTLLYKLPRFSFQNQ